MEIEYVRDENGSRNWFREKNGIFNNEYEEITKECYDNLSTLTHPELSKLVEANLDVCIKYGYGYYGCRIGEIDGKYYIVTKVGNSCD